jgi:hypothetical protein
MSQGKLAPNPRRRTQNSRPSYPEPKAPARIYGHETLADVEKARRHIAPELGGSWQRLPTLLSLSSMRSIVFDRPVIEIHISNIHKRLSSSVLCLWPRRWRYPGFWHAGLPTGFYLTRAIVLLIPNRIRGPLLFGSWQRSYAFHAY